jgi:ABC-2 type transport system permease protein
MLGAKPTCDEPFPQPALAPAEGSSRELAQCIPAPRDGASSRARGPANELARWRLLLSPRFRAARNRLRRLDRRGSFLLAVLGLLGLGFWAAVFVFFYRALRYFLSVPDFGPILTYKLLGMIFLTFFSILLFSNIITSLSTFFLSAEIDRVMAAPISPGLFFYARFGDTIIESSWMVLAFAVPAFLAYGIAHHAGPLFYLLTVVTLPPFLVIPAALGVACTALLVNVFPARRTRDILVLLSVIAVAVLYLSLRMLQPERLVNPEAFASFVQFLAAMQTPSSPFLPSTWAAEILHPVLNGRGGAAIFHLLLLLSTAAALTVLCEALLRHSFLPGWSKAQEGRKARLTQQPAWERLVRVLTLPFAPQSRLLVIKEVKVFFRDTAQWSQLILLLALVVVYLYNFSVLPLAGGAIVTFYFKNVIAFLNLALAGFVTASVSLRFVLPSISLEGRSLWIAKTAPLDMRRVWWSKFWVSLVPLLVLGEVLVVATNYYLNVMTSMMWLSSLTLFCMTFGMVALGLAVGAAYPKFDADNAAKVAAGVGGVVYMILCMSFIGAVVLLEAWPVYALFMGRLQSVPLSVGTQVSIAAALLAALGLTTGVFVGSVRYGVRRLRSMEM